MQNKTIKLNGEEYYTPTKQGYIVSNLLVDLWQNLGKPSDPFSNTGSQLVDVIIATWQDTFPQQYREWIKERKLMHDSELSNSEKIRKHTGRNLAAYPFYIYKLIKTIFPEFKFSDRDNQLKLVKKWPIFKMVGNV